MDLAELSVTDPDFAMNIAAGMAASVTAAASKTGARLSYAAAAMAIKSAAYAQGKAHGVEYNPHASLVAAGLASPERGSFSSSSAYGATAGSPGTPASASSAPGKASPERPASSTGGSGSLPVRDVLAVLPHETVKPTANIYNIVTRAIAPAQHYWHLFMSVCELPVTLARHLTIPLLHEGSYRRRLVLLNVPCCMAFGSEIVLTHILKGSAPTDVGGFPIFVICLIAGVPLAALLNFVLPSNSTSNSWWSKLTHGGVQSVSFSLTPGGESSGLLAAGAGDKSGGGTGGKSTSLLAAEQNSGGVSNSSIDAHGHGGGGHGGAHARSTKKWWIKRLGQSLAGPNNEPLPSGYLFTFFLVSSFIMSLFWLLVSGATPMSSVADDAFSC